MGDDVETDILRTSWTRPTVASVAALAAVAALAGLAPPSASAQEGTPPPPFIQVSASASVDVESDRANVRFAVETQATTAADASAENARRMDAVIRALRALDVTGTEIETTGYQLNPVYSRNDRGGMSTIESYRALNHVVVTVDDVEAVGRLIDAGIGAGANRVAGITFEATDTRQARLDALRMAVEKATEEARIIAVAMGRELGGPLEVQGGAEMPQPYPMYARMEMAQAAEVSTPVEPGEQTVQASVTVKFRIGPRAGG